MRLALIGVDYKTAGIKVREAISLTESKIKPILMQLKELQPASGIAILSTCNRTELYLSCDQYLSREELTGIFCDAVGFDHGTAAEYIYYKTDEKVITYLFELAGGMHSMIFGDDQIASQVGEAIEMANEAGASDAILNTLFRHAVTCAKKIKTSTSLKTVAPSVATQAAGIVKDYIQNKKDCRVLVIGNGEIGRAAARVLLAAGCEVYMTLRTYKYKQNVIPQGCRVIGYEKREELFPEIDILISATKSPHHTVSYEALARCGKKPAYIMDLALPRDIDPKAGELEGVHYYDIDAIGKNARYDNTEEIRRIREIIAGQLEKFKEWLMYRRRKQEKRMEECKR